MKTELFWIEGPWPGRLAISARPRGGDWLEAEICGWRSAGIAMVGSLLEPHEAADLELEHEREICESNGVKFVSLPIVDRGVPASDAEAAQFIDLLNLELRLGRSVNVHCRQGVGRSGLIAAGLLIGNGVSPEEAIRRVSAGRGMAIPETAGQREWIDHFAAALRR